MGLRPLELVDELERRGLRTSAPHLAVYRAADELAGHDAATIVARVRETLGTVSDETARESLEALTAAGLLRRIGPDDAPAYVPGASAPDGPPA
jgi:Fur family transcriptional regulator, stress-responsive regulator